MLGGRGDERVWPKAGRGASLSTPSSISGASFLPLRIPPRQFPFSSALLLPRALRITPVLSLFSQSLKALSKRIDFLSLPSCTTIRPQKRTDGLSRGTALPQRRRSALVTETRSVRVPSFALCPLSVRSPRASSPLGVSIAPISHSQRKV